jgi:hypothetical protein
VDVTVVVNEAVDTRATLAEGLTPPETTAPPGVEPSPPEEESEDSEIEVTEEVFNTTTALVEGLTPTDVKIVEEVLNQKTPVELGFVPPSCRNNTPSNSGDDQDQNQEEDLDEESGVETVDEESDDDDSPRARKLPPSQESRPLSNTHRVVTAAMRKGLPVGDFDEVFETGLDPREMPMHPDNTPPSPPQRHPPRPAVLRNTTRPWNPWIQGQEPGQHPEEPDSTLPVVTPQTKEEVEAGVTKWIRIAREQSNARQFTQTTTPRDNSNQTGCAHFGGRVTPQCPLPQPCGSSSASSAALGIESNKSSRKRICGPPTIRDRLGTKPRQVDTPNKSGSGAQAPEEESDSEEEPKEVTKEDPEPEDMSPLDLLREVLRWRNLFKQKRQREPAEDMSPLDLLREVLRWRNLKKLNKQKKPSEPGDDPEGRQ